MKYIKKTAMAAASVILALHLSSCGLLNHIFESGIFQNMLDKAINGYDDSDTELTEVETVEIALTEFFSALDAGETETIYSQFSETVKKQDADLMEQIDYLISVYPRYGSTVAFDGLYASTGHSEYGRRSITAFGHLPVIVGGEYYWVCFELTYVDDFDSDNIGFKSVCLFTAYEYYKYFYDVDGEYSDDIGLQVYAEKNVDYDIRCVNRIPYKFKSIERNLDRSEVRDFLSTDNTLAGFVDEFGEPNAEDEFSYIYELEKEETSVKYLRISEEDGYICSVDLLDDLNFIDYVFQKIPS